MNILIFEWQIFLYKTSLEKDSENWLLFSLKARVIGVIEWIWGGNYCYLRFFYYFDLAFYWSEQIRNTGKGLLYVVY